jgi:hypothetical protein
MSVCPGIVCEECVYGAVCVLDGRLGKIECGGHGVGWCLLFLRGVFVVLCVRPCDQIYLAIYG